MFYAHLKFFSKTGQVDRMLFLKKKSDMKKYFGPACQMVTRRGVIFFVMKGEILTLDNWIDVNITSCDSDYKYFHYDLCLATKSIIGDDFAMVVEYGTCRAVEIPTIQKLMNHCKPQERLAVHALMKLSKSVK